MSKHDPNIGEPFPNPDIPDLDDENMMRPPWEKYPNIRIGSIGWRMGVGEDYLEKFDTWFSRQARPIRLEIRAKYPAPVGWEFFLATPFWTTLNCLKNQYFWLIIAFFIKHMP